MSLIKNVSLLLVLAALPSRAPAAPAESPSPASPAQSALTVTPTHCVYKMGDDLSWAQPDLDDHGWAAFLPPATLVLPSGPRQWTRCTLDLRPLAKTGPIFIQIEDFSAWQLFIDGEPVGSFGNIESGRYWMDLVQRFPIPQHLADRGVIVVALRETHRGLPPINYSARVDRISAGAERTLVDETALASVSAFSNRLAQFICYGFIGTAGIFLLILSGVDRSRRDMFWLALVCLGMGELRANELAQVFLLHYPEWLLILLMFAGQWTMVAFVQFFFSLAGRKVSVFYLLLSFFTPLIMVAPCTFVWGSPRVDQILWWWCFYFYPSRLLMGIVGIAVATAPIAAFWPLWKMPRELRLFCFVAILWASGEAANAVPRLPWFAGLDATGWARNYRALATTPAIIAMFFLLARRQKKITNERAELKTEMLAAQEMQRLLVPESLDLEPWLTVEVAYLPAKEVGGDFYFCRRTANGQLIVIGDVSGKGLRAAMMASTVVGALRNEASADPAEILARINAVVLQANSGGFVTCLCALFQSNGTLRFANAGHISPYLHGQEIASPAGLPLGLSADAVYEETVVNVEAGTVCLLSDGVVEARNPDGELLGFDRMAALTRKPTSEIAEAAKRWGQEDDITVLTVARMPGLWRRSPDRLY